MDVNNSCQETGRPAGIDKIKRVVVLMFENRSFDHIFGAFPGVNGLLDENGQVNQNYFNLPHPLSPPSPDNLPVYPTPIDPALPQARDFTHDFGDGMMPDIFGPTFTASSTAGPAGPSNPLASYTSGYANGGPIGQVEPVPQTYPPTNSGFYTTFQGCEAQGQAALTYFEHGELKVLHTLAQDFVLCDNWHCDMPGHTQPNRCFMHCATSGSFGIDDSDNGSHGNRSISNPTIFDSIDTATGQQSAWKFYVPVAQVEGAPQLGQVDTSFLNANVQGRNTVPVTEFATDCANGELPFYSFIMCWLPSHNPWTDTSMHPNALIQPGENLLAAVYNTLRNSPCWEDTLLVVTFDENGGIYDHVSPPNTTPPDPSAAPVTQSIPGCCGNQWVLNSTFDFSLLGFRVPALLISPWLASGVDSFQYQNTSVLRFLTDKLNANFGNPVASLTERDANAPPLDSVFSQFGQPVMRQDCPSWIQPYSSLPSVNPDTGSNAIPYSDGTLTIWNP